MIAQHPFKVQADRSGSHLTLFVEGEVDAMTAPELLDAFDQGNIPPATVVWVDLSAVSFFDSSALVALQRLHQRSTEGGASFKLVDPSPMVDRILELTAMDQLIPTYRTPATSPEPRP